LLLLLLLLLLMVVVIKEADCMAGAGSRSTPLLLCHCSNFLLQAWTYPFPFSCLLPVVLHDAVAASDKYG